MDEGKRIGMERFLFERLNSVGDHFSPTIGGGLNIAVAKPVDSTPSAHCVKGFETLIVSGERFSRGWILLNADLVCDKG